MATEQGSLNIIDNGNGTFTTLDRYGRKTQTVSGKNALQSLKDAYGKRIGSVLDSSGNVTSVVNEYKENPRKEVDPSELKEEGTIVKTSTGWGVKYKDGSIHNTGSDREGILEAQRTVSRAKMYNDYITDARTREDFDTDEQYRNHITNKNIRIGQGTFNIKTDSSGATKIVGPKGVVLGSADNLEDARKQMYDKANKLSMALSQKEYRNLDKISKNTIQFVKDSQGLKTDEEAYKSLYNETIQRDSSLRNIYSEINKAAQEQGIDLGGKYSSPIPSFEDFMGTLDIVDDGLSYSDWRKKSGLSAVSTPSTQDVTKEVERETETGVVGDVTEGKGDVVDQTEEILKGDDSKTSGDTIGVEATTEGPGVVKDSVTGTYPTTDVSGTFSTDVDTKDESSLGTPSPIATKNYTGKTMEELTSKSQKGFGGLKKYVNKMTGQTMMISVDGEGKPMVYVPPGFTPEVTTQAFSPGGIPKGGAVEATIARKLLDFEGPDSQLENFLAANPQAAARMGKYRKAMVGMSNKRMGADEGTLVPTPEEMKNMQGSLVSQTMQPTQSNIDKIQPDSADFIASTAGQTDASAPEVEASKVESVEQVSQPNVVAPTTVDAATVGADVKQVTDDLDPVEGEIREGAKITAQEEDESSVSKLKAAQGESIEVTAPNQREIEDGELIDVEGNITGQAEKASKFVEEVQAASAAPSTKATVKGQLADLMADFEGGETPAWAAGSMRAAMAQLSARGLGASSMAGQAVIQAAMEAALPIAQMDAQTNAKFESMNLSNKQQMAVLAAEQRAKFMGQEFDQAFQARVINASKISEIANMNFNADMQIALENSRAANTMELSNLSNSQALIMAEAAALANLDIANLNNRQQAAVQNAQNFLAMDMANLDREQQTTIFKAQQNIAALFSDQAAENAAAQFNASSENQTNQFFASLSSQVSQFNASQKNAVEQFNVNSVNALKEFNANIQQQRDMFNAQNGLVVAQANAQWRQNIATLNTAAQNESNMAFAQTINALTATNLDQIWQRERDLMSFAFTASESEQDRALQIILGDKDLEAVRLKLKSDDKTAKGALWTKLLFGI